MNLDRRLLGEARAVHVHLALAIGAGLLAGVVTVLQAHYLSQTVAQVFLQGRNLAEVQPLLAALLAAIVARAGLFWAKEVAAQQAAVRVKTWLRERLFSRLLALGPAYAWGERTGELANTAVEGIESLDAYFSQYLPNLALAALIPLAILVFVFPLDLISALVFLVTAPLIPIFMVLIGAAADVLAKRQWESLSRLSAHFLDVLQGLPTLKIFGRSREQIEVIAAISGEFRTTTMGVLRVAFISALALELLATISTAIVAVQVGLRLLYATITFEQAFFVLILAPEFYLPLRTLGANFHSGMAGVAAAQRVFAVLETPAGDAALASRPWASRPRLPGERADIGPEPSPQPSPKGRGSGEVSISFSDVHYAYEDGQRPALHGISFFIAGGQKVALVGPSGAGKSTVAHLLLRFVEPDRGQITVAGVPLGDLPVHAWREQVAWVPQNPYLFHASVAENIRLARPNASPAQVEQAARLANAHEFVDALPQGYDTVVGERGARLSGGQAQRIALARAFLKDAPFLILDEAAANLDAEQEALVQAAIDHLLVGRTALIIAHRLGTVVGADQILVLAGGRITEAGTHRALLQQGGLYHQLVTAYKGAV